MSFLVTKTEVPEKPTTAFTSKSPSVNCVTRTAILVKPGKLTSKSCFVPLIGAMKYTFFPSLLQVKLSTVPSQPAVKLMSNPL